jgi:hypothetical protein
MPAGSLNRSPTCRTQHFAALQHNEPKWVHGKRRVAEPARLLPAAELADRVCAALGCPHEAHLSLSDDVA